MKFVCGNCGEVIREVDSPMAFAGWQRHEDCKTETYFERFIVRPNQKDAQPVAVRVREAGSISEGVSVAQWKALPSAADLDAVAAEQKVATETGAPSEDDAPKAGQDDTPREKRKWRK